MCRRRGRRQGRGHTSRGSSLIVRRRCPLPYRDTTGQSTAGRSGSMQPNASAACAASRPASARTTSPPTRTISAPGSSAMSTSKARRTRASTARADPVNIAASGSEGEYRFANRYKDAKVEKAFFVPKLCNHCTHPACVQVCPTGATYKTDDGVVVIDHTYCIGCQYCVQACPYGARFFNEEKQVTDKCTWCYHRITKGLQPACVEVCPVGARIFGDRNDKDSPISQFLRNNRVQRTQAGNRQCAECLLCRPRQGRDLMEPLFKPCAVHRLRLPERDGHPMDRADRRLSVSDRARRRRVHRFEPVSGVRHSALQAGRASCAADLAVLHGRRAQPLLLHLGHPERAFNAMITPHTTSAFAIFGYAASFYVLLLMLENWFVFRPHIVRAGATNERPARLFYRISRSDPTTCPKRR